MCRSGLDFGSLRFDKGPWLGDSESRTVSLQPRFMDRSETQNGSDEQSESVWQSELGSQSESDTSESDNKYFDVVIVGGGLAGLTLARQIRSEIPTWSIAIVERQPRPLPEAAWKVGESSVEVGSRYFEELGLSHYLLERQLVKFGLRFFPGGSELPIHQRTEVGPSQEPIVRSYQLDRGRFESDLRAALEADGVVLFEGHKAADVVLQGEGGEQSGAPATECSSFTTYKHRVTVTPIRSGRDAALSARFNLTCKWLVDASGREAVLRRRLQLRDDSRHVAHSGWFRVGGKVDINDWVPRDRTHETARWHGEEWSSERWRSTNHLMGPGYWCWIIPLASGNTSVGIVVHEEFFPFTAVNTKVSCETFLAQYEPQLYEAVKDRVVMDFRCLRGYSHGAHDLWSSQRYAVVGEAGAFVDPLYSPGSDFIAFANSFTVELMRRDARGEALAEPVAAFNERYHELVSRAVELYRTAGPIYGHAGAMAAKVYFDNFAYWAFFAQYFFQKFFRDMGNRHDRFVALGVQLATLSQRMQTLLRGWAQSTQSELGPVFVGMPRFPSLLVDVYMDLRQRRDIDEACSLLELRVQQAREIAAELALRVLLNAGPELGPRLLTIEQQPLNTSTNVLESWGITSERIDAEFLPGLARRKALSAAVRDVERTLGRVSRHPLWSAALCRAPSNALVPPPEVALDPR